MRDRRERLETLKGGIATATAKALERKDDVSDADKARAKKEYGDVKYADPQNRKYPIDSKDHVKAAWSYINMAKNAKFYTAEALKTVKGRIKAAAKKFGIEIGDDAQATATAKSFMKEEPVRNIVLGWAVADGLSLSSADDFFGEFK